MWLVLLVCFSWLCFFFFRLIIFLLSLYSFLFFLLTVFLDFNIFDLITSENDCIKSKPDPEIYLNSIQKTQIPKHLSVAIEDSESGFYSAEKAGLKCLVVPGEYKKSQNYPSSADVLPSLKNFHIDQKDSGFCSAYAVT